MPVLSILACMGIVSHPPAPSERLALRELPVVLAATALVAVLPALLATWILPARGVPAILAAAVLAMAIAAVVTRIAAAAWSRTPGRRDRLFCDLMLWSWVRTRWTERRLTAAQRRLLAADATTTGMPLGALTRMSRLLEARDVYTYGHSRRVARHAATIARALHLPPEEVERIRRAALVHDIGKIYTPKDILEKPARLSDAEFAIVKRHPGDGAELLSHLGEPEVVAIVRHHHERLDGGGYPDGLRGAEIPLGARIIAVADTFDALTSTRSYRRSTSHEKALAILAAEAGTQLDADAVAAFRRRYSASRPAALAAAAASGGERVLSWAGGATAGLGSGAIGAAATATAAAALTLGPALAPITGSAPAAHRAAIAGTGAAATFADVSSPAVARPSARSKPVRTIADRPRVRRHPAPRPREQAPVGAPATSAPTSTPAPATPASDAEAAAAAILPRAPATAVPAAPVPTTPQLPPVATPSPAQSPAVTTPAVTTPAVTTPVATVPAITVPAVPVRLPLSLPAGG